MKKKEYKVEWKSKRLDGDEFPCEFFDEDEANIAPPEHLLKTWKEAKPKMETDHLKGQIVCYGTGRKLSGTSKHFKELFMNPKEDKNDSDK